MRARELIEAVLCEVDQHGIVFIHEEEDDPPAAVLISIDVYRSWLARFEGGSAVANSADTHITPDTDLSTSQPRPRSR